MEFLLNERSVHGQFTSAGEFFTSIENIMSMRAAIRDFGNELYCHRSLATAQVTNDALMQQVIQHMPLEKRLAWIQWLTRLGPYWTDDRSHDGEEWLECGADNLVTDSAIGEAAFCRFHGAEREIVSFSPSIWVDQNIDVRWCRSGLEPCSISIVNHIERRTVDARISKLPKPFSSWESLRDHAVRLCPRLSFTEDAFVPFAGVPYSHGAATQLLIRFQLLDKFRSCFDGEGNRTAEGDRIYQENFTGKKAWFSDSSDTEKREFNNEMTFAHPEQKGKYLQCTWHGKVKTPQLRLHFSWPITANKPVYVVYVGPKITKR